MSNFEGDPRIIITASGATLQFNGGQPLMDQGMENDVLIALFSLEGWAGNEFIRDANSKIGSKFESAHEQPFMVDSFVDIEQAALNALQYRIDSGVSANITATTFNPSGKTISTLITDTSPSGDQTQILLEKNGVNWLAQAVDPAYQKVTIE